MDTSHSRLVDAQFGAQAEAYVASAVHASGWDLDRMEAVFRARKPETALDLGCGGGHVSYRAALHAKQVTACDLAPAMLDAVARTAASRGLPNIRTVQARAEALPFAAESFDTIASRFSAHHWSDVAAGLREARRVLRPGGAFLMLDAVSPGSPLLDTHLQAVEALRDPSHVRDYAPAEWLAMLGEAGFAVERTEARTLRLDFADWTQRMRTPDTVKAAIRYLQEALPDAAKHAFAIEPDGSFLLPVLLLEARTAP